MSRYNRFEVDGRGRAFVNGVEVDNVRKIETRVEEFGINVVELTFEADESVINTTRKSKCGFMDFGRAIEALKRGRKIAREGWNGKDMFLFLAKGEDLTACICGDDMPPCTDSICMQTAQNTVAIGWLASQTDVLAEDWKIVE